jgi:hypothetical protein
MRMNELREFDRRGLNLEVVAMGSIRCIVTDLSRSGARLRCDRRLPNLFYIALQPELKRWCKVIWRKRDEVGVSFVHAPKSVSKAELYR